MGEGNVHVIRVVHIDLSMNRTTQTSERLTAGRTLDAVRAMSCAVVCVGPVVKSGAEYCPARLVCRKTPLVFKGGGEIEFFPLCKRK